MNMDINNFLNENESIINELFLAREDKLGTASNIDKKYIKELKERRKEFELALDSIPMHFTNEKASIDKTFNDYTETSNYANSYINEVYYKNGVVDGIKLILESLKDYWLLRYVIVYNNFRRWRYGIYN